MAVKNLEELVDHNLMEHDHARKIITDVGDSTWGQLILPSKKEGQDKTEEGMRILIIGSYTHGYLLVETMKEFEKRCPSRLTVVGLATDDPVSPEAKISVKKRIWRMFGSEEIARIETDMIEAGLTGGIPVYTGALKTEYFRNLLEKWDPEVILVCVCGQILDEPIINYPNYGIYNFHPADLLAGHGAGPQPFQDLIERKAYTSKLTIHQLTTGVDEGPIVGQSSPVNVRSRDGSLTNDIPMLVDKLAPTIDTAGAILIKTLILNKESGLVGKIGELDFSKHFSQQLKDYLMRPISANTHSAEPPKPSKYVDYDF